jgi:DNA modification methylase
VSVRIIEGDCLASLRTLPDASVQCCVTSPPYYGLRDYGVEGQIGLEDTPDAYVARLVGVFREVRRVLADDGTLWLNLGDSYAATGKSGGGAQGARWADHGADTCGPRGGKWSPAPAGTKPKDLLGIPWMVAFAVRADGWFLRSDIIWHKPNPMPESVRDRPTSAHEHVFLLSKRDRYFYDAEAIAEPFADERMGASGAKALPYSAGSGRHDSLAQDGRAGLGAHPAVGYRNARNVWTIATQPFAATSVPGWNEDHDHYAVMPPDLAERCVKAGSKPGDTVLDPFGGAGTTGMTADRLGRHAILCELNPKNVRLARARIAGDAPLFAEVFA